MKNRNIISLGLILHSCFILFFWMMLTELSFSSESLVRVNPQSYGVALSFDDDFIEQWYKARDIFKAHNARITFFICRYHKFTPEKKQMLHELERDGHEIAYHSVNHIDAKEYLKNHTLDEYIANEITPDLLLMNKDGFFPRSFAYPWGGKTPQLESLMAKKFLVLRQSGRLGENGTIFIPGEIKQNIIGASLDSSRFNQESFDRTLENIEKAKKGIAIFYTHRIVSEDIPQSHISPQVLDTLLSSINHRGLSFYTYSELASPPPTGRELIYHTLSGGTLDKANLLMEDIWPVDRFTDTALPNGPTWTEDPFNEKYWRFFFYALRPLQNLLFAWTQNSDINYLKKCLTFVESFFQHKTLSSPFVNDPHTSAFLSMMLVNLYTKFEQGEILTPQFRKIMTDGIRNRALFLADEKNFESGYNHGLTEATALLLTSETFPFLAEASAWRTLALKRLSFIIQETVDSDGSEIEQSPFYHFYVLKFLWEIEKWSKKYSIALDLQPVNLTEVIKKMLKFGSAIIQPNGEIALLGASTRYDLFKDRLCGEMKALDPYFEYVYTMGKKGRMPPYSSILFKTAGLSVLRSAYDKNKPFSEATHILFDVGPYRTNHSHLDALNFTFYANRPLLIDAGLFTYESGERRNYYSGTSAHNTVTIDGKNQKKGDAIPKKFMTHPSGWAYQSGEHSLYKGFTHKRGILYLRRGIAIVIDHLKPTENNQATHTFDNFLHLATDLTLTESSRHKAFIGKDKKGKTELILFPLQPSSALEAKITTGWASTDYEKEEPAEVLQLSQNVAKGATFITLLIGGGSVNDEQLKTLEETLSTGQTEAESNIIRNDINHLEISFQLPQDQGGKVKAIIENFMNADESVQVMSL